MRLYPLSIEEIASNDGFTHMAVLTSDDLTTATANTAQKIKLCGLIIGDIIRKVAIRIVTPFQNTADTAFNTSTVSLGDNTSATHVLAAQETNNNANATFNDGVTNTDTSLVSATAAFVAGDVGKVVKGAGIPAGTTIATRTNATTVVLSGATTATATSVSITIAGRTPTPVSTAEVIGSASSTVYTAADELDVTFNAMAAKNLNAINQGELHVLFTLYRTTTLSTAKVAAASTK